MSLARRIADALRRLMTRGLVARLKREKDYERTPHARAARGLAATNGLTPLKPNPRRPR